ncbi:MAG: hypothetical protein B9S34_05205 [Opitutia bacterium Tous-C1TDCM]|nr:MAG: hypothetical protein B9S34_05205 [Opitutae bacterium Tous-C1TDCM]
MKRMKTLLGLLLCCCAGMLQAQVETIDLGARGKITLYLLGEWSVDYSTLGKTNTVSITPKQEGVNASCTLAFTFPEIDRLETKARLKSQVETDCFGLAEGSAERKAVARELAVRAGIGFACNFTDPELIGQPPKKGDYKVTTVGKVKLAPDVVIDVQILADGFKDEPYQQLLGAIEGMEFAPGRGR